MIFVLFFWVRFQKEPWLLLIKPSFIINSNSKFCIFLFFFHTLKWKLIHDHNFALCLKIYVQFLQYRLFPLMSCVILYNKIYVQSLLLFFKNLVQFIHTYSLIESSFFWGKYLKIYEHLRVSSIFSKKIYKYKYLNAIIYDCLITSLALECSF